MNFNCTLEVYPAALYIVYNKYHTHRWQDVIYLAKRVIHLFHQYRKDTDLNSRASKPQANLTTITSTLFHSMINING